MSKMELFYKILFLIFSIMWAGNILLFRSERQMIINPVLIIIASILVVLPNTEEFFGINVDEFKSKLYIIYYVVVMLGLIITICWD